MENIPNCTNWTLIPKPPPCSPWLDMKFNIGTYANSCANSINPSLGVPKNDFGLKNYQFAHNGNGYLLFKALNSNTPSLSKSGKIYQQVHLVSNLISGRKYYCGFFTVLTDSSKYATNNIAMNITDNLLVQDTSGGKNGNLSDNPQILNYRNPVIKDTQNWVLVSGIYTAKGGEQFITIGNFKNNTETAIDSNFNNSQLQYALYLLDDVFVYELNSTYCLKANAGRDTTIKINDSVFIGSYTNGIDTIKWFNAAGQVIDSTRPGFWVKPTATGNYMYVVEQTVNGCYSRDTVYVNAVLPLKFLSYSCVPSLRGTKQSADNLWQTANEINVSHYNIQRSTNAKDFTTIGVVKAKNKSYNEYEFIDDSPLTTADSKSVYYRIEAVDKDGKLNYSSTKQINLSTTQPISIFPNPAKDVINVVGDNIQLITITTIEGKQVLSSTTKTVNVGNLAKGIYIISVVKTNGCISNEKLIIQ